MRDGILLACVALRAGYIPIEGLRPVRRCGIFLLRGYDRSDGGVYSYCGATTGPTVMYIPIEGLRPVRRCGIFLLRGYNRSGGVVCSF
eukprot:1192208-Prorocentrum_minimum.AAC.1